MDSQSATFTSPLEHRLRQRIDDLIDERDQLKQQLETIRKTNKRNRQRTYQARKTAELWRIRARGLRFQLGGRRT